MSLRKEEIIWESEILEVLKIEKCPNWQDFWKKDHTDENDQENTNMDYTLEQKHDYTPDNSKGRAYMLGHKLTYGKNGKITLMSDMMLVMTLFMLLLECSNYTSKKRESPHFEERHQTRGAMVGELQHIDDVLSIGSKNTARSLPKRNWRYRTGYEGLDPELPHGNRVYPSKTCQAIGSRKSGKQPNMWTVI